MGITIYGSSDDLVEIEGDINEEFNWCSELGESRYLAFSDGTLLRVRYDDNGIWRLHKICGGSSGFEKTEGDIKKDTVDKVILSGVGIKWVLFGDEISMSHKFSGVD